MLGFSRMIIAKMTIKTLDLWPFLTASVKSLRDDGGLYFNQLRPGWIKAPAPVLQAPSLQLATHHEPRHHLSNQQLTNHQLTSRQLADLELANQNTDEFSFNYRVI